MVRSVLGYVCWEDGRSWFYRPFALRRLETPRRGGLGMCRPLYYLGLISEGSAILAHWCTHERGAKSIENNYYMDPVARIKYELLCHTTCALTPEGGSLKLEYIMFDESTSRNRPPYIDHSICLLFISVFIKHYKITTIYKHQCEDRVGRSSNQTLCVTSRALKPIVWRMALWFANRLTRRFKPLDFRNRSWLIVPPIDYRRPMFLVRIKDFVNAQYRLHSKDGLGISVDGWTNRGYEEGEREGSWHCRKYKHGLHTQVVDGIIDKRLSRLTN